MKILIKLIARFLRICSKIQSALIWRYNEKYAELLGVKHGSKFKLLGKIYIQIGQNATVQFGENFLFLSSMKSNPLACSSHSCIFIEDGAKLMVGANVGISSTILWVCQSITIGNNVKIGGGSILMDTDAHSLHYMDRRDVLRDDKHRINQSIVIDDDVFIGTHSIILKGVHIGARSIVGAGSVVTKDIPQDCIAAGNPAKVIKRNSEK